MPTLTAQYIYDYGKAQGWSDAKIKKEIQDAEEYGEIAPRKDGIIEEGWEGIQYGVLTAAKGVGSTIEEAGLGSGVYNYFKGVEERNQDLRPYPGYKAASLDPVNISRTIGTGVGQSGAALVGGAATTAATGGNVFAGGAAITGMVFAQTYGDEVKEFRQLMPNQSEDTVKGLAFVSSLGQGLIESVAGPEAIASGVAKKIVTGAIKDTVKKFGKQRVKQVLMTIGKNAVKGGLGEGAEEVFQGVISNVAKRAGGVDVPVFSFDEAVEQFAGGALPGIVLGGGGGVVEVSNQGTVAPEQKVDITGEVKPTEVRPGAETPMQTRTDIDEQGAAEPVTVQKADAENIRDFEVPENAGTAQPETEQQKTKTMALESGSETLTEPVGKTQNRQVNPFTPGSAAATVKEQYLDNYEPERVTKQGLDAEADAIIQKEGIPQIISELENRNWDSALNQRLLRKVSADPQVQQNYLEGKDAALVDLIAKQTVSGTQIGQALQSRTLDKSTDPLTAFADEIRIMLMKPSKYYNGTLDSAKKEAQKALDLAKEIQAKYGVDPMNLTPEQINNKKLMSRVLTEISTNKATRGDKLYEYWINSILSGIRTHAANVTGNTAMAAIELGPQRFTEAAINMFAKNKQGATFGEFRHMWKALRTSIKPAWKKAVEAYDLERPTAGDGTKLETRHGPAIKGKHGRVIRTFGRLLLAADELAKAVIIPIESNAFAYRTAKAEGLTGDALTARMNELISDPESDASRWGKLRAKELTFQTDLGTGPMDSIVARLMAAKQDNGFSGTVLKYVFPSPQST